MDIEPKQFLEGENHKPFLCVLLFCVRMGANQECFDACGSGRLKQRLLKTHRVSSLRSPRQRYLTVLTKWEAVGAALVDCVPVFCQ